MIYFQLEKLQKIPGEKLPRRKLLRNTYESTGPNDERYYVSNSSGFGKNKLFFMIYYNYLHLQERMQARQKLTLPVTKNLLKITLQYHPPRQGRYK